MARPAGWYPHPELRDALGYWDGADWTGHAAPIPDEGTYDGPPQPPAPSRATQTTAVAPRAATQSAPKPRDKDGDLAVLGYVLAVLFPVGGLVVGIALLGKSRIGPGLAVLLTTVVSVAVWSGVAANLL